MLACFAQEFGFRSVRGSVFESCLYFGAKLSRLSACLQLDLCLPASSVMKGTRELLWPPQSGF